MKLVPVTKLPDRVGNCEHKNVNKYLGDFLKMNVKYARVEFTNKEYSRSETAFKSFYRVIGLCDHPIKVRQVNGELYLIRTDMED